MSRPPIIRVSGLDHPDMNGIYVDNWGAYYGQYDVWIEYYEESAGIVHWQWMVYDEGIEDYGLMFSAITQSADDFPATDAWIAESSVPADGLVIESAVIAITSSSDAQMINYTAATLSAKYKQTQDIYLTYATPIGTSSNRFRGMYDGQGYKIYNWSSGTSYLPDRGYFGQVQNAKIINTHLRNSTLYCDGQSGTLIGDAWGMTIVRDCSATGVLYARFNNQGGLIGRTSGGIVERCWSNVTMVGQTARANIVNHGGLIGTVANWSGSTLIKDCYALANVSGGANCDNVGGLIGYVYQDPKVTIVSCYSKGLTSGRNAVGQLTGLDAGTTGAVWNCYWISDNAASTSASGQRLSLAEAREHINYNGWNFRTVWNISPETNSGFPHLAIRSIPSLKGIFGIKKSIYRLVKYLYRRHINYFERQLA